MLAWLFSVIGDERHETVRRETVHVRREAFCEIGAVAMGYELWAMGFKRCLPAALCYNRSLRSLTGVAGMGKNISHLFMRTKKDSASAVFISSVARPDAKSDHNPSRWR